MGLLDNIRKVIWPHGTGSNDEGEEEEELPGAGMNPETTGMDFHVWTNNPAEVPPDIRRALWGVITHKNPLGKKSPTQALAYTWYAESLITMAMISARPAEARNPRHILDLMNARLFVRNETWRSIAEVPVPPERALIASAGAFAYRVPRRR